MKSEYKGDILSVRTVEDCIRATRKYTKGAFSRVAKHPVQGDDFPSKVLTEYYEVYPDTEVSWDMSAAVAWAWVWGDVTRIDVRFYYDYRANQARVIVYGGETALRELVAGIPGFEDALAAVGVLPASVEATESVIVTEVGKNGQSAGKPATRKRRSATGAKGTAKKPARQVLDSPDRVGARIISHP